MQISEHKPNQEEQSHRSIFRFDALLFVFLVLGWSLIFVTATLALERINEDWVDLSSSDSSADYSVDAQDVPKLAQVNPQIIEAVREDQRVREQIETEPSATPGVVLPDVIPTIRVSPTPSVTPSPGNLLVNAGGPYQVDEGSPAALTAKGFNSLLSILPRGVTYVWDLDGDGLYDDAEGISTEITFFDEGDYPVSVRASDLLGRSATDLTMVRVDNVPPTVELGEDLASNEGEEISFFANVSDPGQDILLYEWNFGDGSPTVDGTLNPTHIYQQDGEYLVHLRVSDNDGGLTDSYLTVSVANLPPLVVAGPAQAVDEGSPITFSGTATDPADDPDDLEYAWDFDYDGETFNSDGSGPIASTIYRDGPADIVAALRVKDEDGGETIETVDVRVNNVAPVITRVSHDGPAGEGSSITFEVEATDVGDDTLTYAFDWDNDGAFDTADSSTSASNIWYNQGNHKVQIRVDDGDGGEAFTTTVVSTYNLTPTAVAQIVSPSPFYEGSAISFDGSESSDPGGDSLSYQWDFGDGQTSTDQNPVHTFADNGTYDVTLTVQDDSGASATTSLLITILNKNPIVDTIPDRTVDEGVGVTFVGNATDPGSADISSLTYEWDFDYDGAFANPPNVAGKSVTWTYPDGFNPAKTYVVALRVRDNDYPNPVGGGQNGETIRTFNVTIINVPPTVNAGGPYTEDEDIEVVLTGKATDVPADSLTYEWDFNYDGTFNPQPGFTTLTVTWVWPEAGTYDVALRVTDKDGGSTIGTTVAYINAPPTANPGGPYTGSEGSPIVFDGSGSSDPEDGYSLTTYNWTFGDGSPTTGGMTVTHIYADNDVYTATLTVTDSDGSTNTDAVTVTVHNANPTAFAGSDQSVDEGSQAALSGSATDPGLDDVLSYAWDFDYNGNPGDFNEDASGPLASWPALDGPSVITVALRVRDDDYLYSGGGEAGEDIDTLVITVANVPPIVTINGPFNGVEGEAITLSGTAADVSADTLTYSWDLNNDGNFDDGTGESVTYTWDTGGVYPIALQVDDGDGGIISADAMIDINFKPTDVNAGGPYTGDEGTPITFSGSATDPDGGSLTYTWDFGDGESDTGATVDHIYADSGDYIVTLTVSDDQGGITVVTTTASVSNLPPVAADIKVNPDPGIEGDLITFDDGGSTDLGSADTLSYDWDFGDGTSDTGATVTHRYDDDLDYTVTLTVRDDDGGADTISIVVTILNENPWDVDAGGPYLTTVDVPTTLTGSATDVPGDISDLTYEWELNGDGNFDDASGPNPTYTWTTPGNYNVRLRVTDGDGGSTTATTNADVGSPPTADAGGPYTKDEGQAVSFDGSGSDDPDGDPLIYTWDFGDGQTSNEEDPVHTYADSGDYTVTLTVDDGRGGIDTDSTTVTINNLPPDAQASANPSSALEGTLITFSGSADDPGVDDVLTYSWDFGDGNTDSGDTVTHTYDDDGTYTVSLTVTDDEGATDTVSFDVIITNADPVAVINANPNPAPEGTAMTFDGLGSSDPGVDDVLTYSWDFGDGNTDSGDTVPHTYDDDGTYTVSLTVTDDEGDSHTTTLDVTVTNSPPANVDAGGPYSTAAGEDVDLTGSGSDISADPLTYRWDLDGDGSFETEGQTVTFNQAISGTYTVGLEVSDDEGATATDTADVIVNSILPLIWISLPAWLRRRKRARPAK